MECNFKLSRRMGLGFVIRRESSVQAQIQTQAASPQSAAALRPQTAKNIFR
jgi:hypothetical protein